jgi:hypothetical protein
LSEKKSWSKNGNFIATVLTFSVAGMEMTLGDTAVTIGGRYLSDSVKLESKKKRNEKNANEKTENANT